MISSMHTQQATLHSSNHMMRKTKVNYLIDPSCKDNEYKKYSSIEDFKKFAPLVCKEKTGRTMQKKAKDNLILEAVINIKKETTIEDIEKVFRRLNKEFTGHEVFEIAIHKDEGYFYHKKEELEYRPQADIFYNEIDKSFYLDRELKVKANMSKFEKRFNYHAHILYTKFDRRVGKNARLNRSDMRKLQTIVAEELGMQRGEEFSRAKRMTHWQLKSSYDIKRKKKKELNYVKKDNTLNKVKIVNLNKEIKELKRLLIQSKTAKKEDYKELKSLENLLKRRIKTKKDLSFKELYNLTNSFLDNYIKLKRNSVDLNEKVKSKIELINELKLLLNERGEKLVNYDNSVNQLHNKINLQKRSIIELKEELSKVRDLNKLLQSQIEYGLKIKGLTKEIEKEDVFESLENIVNNRKKKNIRRR